jgi:hypothetical protein
MEIRRIIKALWIGSSRGNDKPYGVACTVSLQNGRPILPSCEGRSRGLDPIQSTHYFLKYFQRTPIREYRVNRVESQLESAGKAVRKNNRLKEISHDYRNEVELLRYLVP